MKTFIANFGKSNYLWPTCFARPSVATIEDEDLRALWLAGDRESYIARCVADKRTHKGLTPSRQLASRWFNLAHIISSTQDDIWIHREKDDIWWTISRPGEVDVAKQPAFSALDGGEVYVLHKSCDLWSNKNKKGTPLNWRVLHPKARDFLFTEGTLQELSADHAAYAKALIDGDDLTPWHSRPLWKAKQTSAKHGPSKIFSPKEISAARMAQTALDTVATANGQLILSTAKIKECQFNSKQDLERYIVALIEAQDGLCALTGLSLQFDGECDDEELKPSLDRIDSDGHYADGNLQIVCKFVNRWKNNRSNAEFQRLLGLLRQQRSQ